METKRLQAWPSGQSFTYRGDHSRWDRLEILEGDKWVRPSYEEFVKIHNAVLAEIYAERDVLTCQTSLVEMLLEQEDDNGFSFEDVVNVYRPQLNEDEFKVWNAGCNMPGYMPDEPPHPCYSREQAIESLEDSMENALDAWCDVPENQGMSVAKLAKLTECVEILKEHGCCDFLDYHYFISEDVLTREQLNDLDCDPDDYTAVDDEPFDDAREVYEWWLVSDWLVQQLEGIGVPVLRNEYGNWWGRTCTGQGYIMDGTLQEVAAQFCSDRDAIETP